MTENTLSQDFLEACASDPAGPVALHLRQHLLPVEGPGAPFFPPTFADLGYNIDELNDGTKVALVDSVGSQANRMEPLFLEEPYRKLVPQVDIRYGDEKKGTDGVVSLLEAGHRLGDAVVRCTEIREQAQQAFLALKRGDATHVAKLAPTSLVFGAWDSRDTGVKIARIVQASVRAWDVSELSRSAQYIPALDYAEQEVFSEAEKQKAEGNTKSPLAQRGFVHVPSGRAHGGVIAHGPIRRDVTVNLVALRRLDGDDGKALRSYILGLAIVAASEPHDEFLRQGCLLVPDPDRGSSWTSIMRTGERNPLKWSADAALTFVESAAKAFGVGEDRELKFDKKLAQADVKEAKKKG